MVNAYLARQPILNREQQTIGYELLFRDGPDNSFPEIEPEFATNRLLSDHLLSTQHSMLDGLLGFINFPYQSLLKRVPTLFSKDNLVIEILETCSATPELLEAVIELAQLGYRLALDDFIPHYQWQPFLPYISIIKFDIRSISIEQAALFIQKNKHHNILFLAEKVETHEEFQQALAADFDYFQGYFFSRPELLQRKALEPSFLTVIQLCRAISKPELDFQELEQLISSDLTLSYKLLTFVNSSAIISAKINSFKQALVYLGEERLRKFISLVALASTRNKQKPSYLYSMAVQRARYCELLAAQLIPNTKQGDAFLVGMFSLLDSLLDQPLSDILNEVPIDDDLKHALLREQGVLGQTLALVKAHERADWQQVTQLSRQLSLSESILTQAYSDSVYWTKDLMRLNH